MNESTIDMDAPQVPQLANAVHMLRSIGGVVDAATSLATLVVLDLDTRLAPLDADTRAAVQALCDAVFTADHQFTPR